MVQGGYRASRSSSAFVKAVCSATGAVPSGLGGYTAAGAGPYMIASAESLCRVCSSDPLK